MNSKGRNRRQLLSQFVWVPPRPPLRFVTRQRITRAEQLVVRPPRILSRTGGRLREPSHFTKVSRRATGATPVKEGNEEAYAEMEKNIPIGRAGRPEEIASAVLWFCSPGAIYVVGHALTVDGGMTVL